MSKSKFGNAVLSFMNGNGVIGEDSEDFNVLRDIFEKTMDGFSKDGKITHKLKKNNKYNQWYIEETFNEGVYKGKNYMVYVY